MRRSIRAAAVLVAFGSAMFTLGGCSKEPPESSWAKVKAPLVKDQTDDIVVNDGTLADGTYWATISLTSGTGDIVFRVMKARFGDTCMKWAKDNGMTDACMDDYNVDSFTDAYAALDNRAEVSVAKPDGPGTNFSINVDTLKALMHGVNTQVGGAPKGYTWVPFPFVVAVTNGYVTTANQYWVP
jgi:hypothetical protein